MGYTTEFTGSIAIEPPLNAEEISYLKKFAESRRMDSEQGPYYVDREGFMGQGTEGVRDYNRPPAGQPGLWCQWVPTEDGTELVWDEGEKFYEADKWMAYLIDHFLKPGARAAGELKFLQANHTCNGRIQATGEDPSDMWDLVVDDNQVRRYSVGRSLIGDGFVVTA